MTPELGIIEGYFGRPWDWAARADVVATLAPAGYRFFLHAPKADAFLRRRWREPHPDVEMEAIAAFAGICRERGVRFGIGLSPYEAYIDFDSATRDALAAKLGWLDSLGLDDLAILFDDMRGDLPDLAERQAGPLRPPPSVQRPEAAGHPVDQRQAGGPGRGTGRARLPATGGNQTGERPEADDQASLEPTWANSCRLG